ncbi:zinc finger protein ubi-d4 B-like isoform X2 [Actinia tenebrosa]|uniref:Zinc finger protein ubi-d4 B-like isoform X2 n=1 Tax=Actinia tenebrosa TaxID=6105 RepID=A0A6P8HT15_ACTTE|nr:zinc finger protein ubi-d4 B-like isoform X2 [Actinia tenebrosa]
MAARGVAVRESKQPKEIYQDALDNVSAFNARLCFERKMRAPFLDAQTGIAMNNCSLWLSRFMRREPKTPQYIYTYPEKRWRKRKRIYHPENDEEEGSHVENEEGSSCPGEPDSEQTSEVPESSAQDVVKDDVIEQEVVPLDSSDLEEDIEESTVVSDDEEYEAYKRKKPGRPGRKKGVAVGASAIKHFPRAAMMSSSGSLTVRNITKEELARMNPDDRKKPYVCEICGRRYKNGPGLKYHYTHYNHDLDNNPSQEESHPSMPTTPASSMIAVESPNPPSPAVKVARKMDGPRLHTATPNSYCDFCLGDRLHNKKTGASEELLSCADCGRSGHPSCLQFTARLTENVKKYHWQCIECKSCSLCGTSDNDDQLLFCDDCDRGYHMYCLKPPMSKPPEGHWMCNLCRASLVIQPMATVQLQQPS